MLRGRLITFSDGMSARPSVLGLVAGASTVAVSMSILLRLTLRH
jgi:hypothetical protein